MSEWVSVEDCLPELAIDAITGSPNGEGFSDNVLVWIDDGFAGYAHVAAYQYRGDDSKWLVDNEENWYTDSVVTHWQYLPEPPDFYDLTLLSISETEAVANEVGFDEMGFERDLANE